MCAKFLVSGLIFIFISCQQLLIADDRCYEKKERVFSFVLKIIHMPNFSSIGQL